MSDYSELIDRLHEGAAFLECSTPGLKNSFAKMLHNAAEAIDELQKERDGWIEQERKAMLKSLPKWISVKEHLPEKPYGCLLLVWDSPYDGGDDFLNYFPRFAGWDGERWNDSDGQQVPFEVEYWMPLPEPPKEVRNCDS